MPTSPAPIQFPEWFDELAALEAEHKGCLLNFPLSAPGRAVRRFNFYDPVRLQQDCQQGFAQEGFWHERRVVVLPAVTRAHIIRFACALWRLDIAAG